MTGATMYRSHPRSVLIQIPRFTQLRRIFLVLLVAIMLLLVTRFSLAQTDWPKIVLPKGVSVFDIGTGQTTVNGMPIRMQGFVSAHTPAQVAERFRQSMGKPLVENSVGNQLVLGRLQGEHYLTVQLEAAGAGTRGLLTVTHLKAAYERQAETQADTERWLARLPSGSRMISRMSSRDGSKLANHLVIVNHYDEDLNRDRLTALMREDGLEPEREAVADNAAALRLPAATANGKALFFKGPGKEAMAVIYRDEMHRTAIVLNTNNLLERMK
jgi:hypothetical protein